MSDRHSLTPYSLRISADLRTKLESSAGKIKRSLNAEIVARLEESFSRDAAGRADSIDLGTLFKELQDVKEQLQVLSRGLGK